ncbi:hypothetical protein [Compostibacter hankyongensis]|uniref:Inosine/uridine-preferring nucleoside hydrolase domain-containing protein n=1 Tax=Compostibacter hankyongensis TaxID=1007089 RepID=A0ABP8FT72_9BACT
MKKARTVIARAALVPLMTGLLFVRLHAQQSGSPAKRIPVIVITDLYHPYQDFGDNFDLVTAYALPEIDLKAVILDVTDAFRKPVADHPTLWRDPRGPREAGIIPVMQLNYIFNRNIPFACGPFTPMRSPWDKMQDIPGFQQEGIQLLLKTLRESPVPVEILSFGSARPLAVAYNRSPALFRRKVKRIHLSAGTAAPDMRPGKDKGANAIPGGEWNVALDVNAFIRLLQSDLPVALYPCATRDGAFVCGQHNTYWQLPGLSFIRTLPPKLHRYLTFAYNRTLRPDFLRAMDDNSAKDTTNYAHPHHVWETALWIMVSGRKLVQRADGSCRLVPQDSLRPDDRIIPATLQPCTVKVRSDGRFSFSTTGRPSNFSIYYRQDPVQREKGLQEALPALYKSYVYP